ncbi:MAG: alpha/beta hydrolase family protein [Acidobacteriota bacterium]
MNAGLKALAALTAFAALAARADEVRFADLLREFSYDVSAPFDVRETEVENRGGVVIRDMTYASPRGGRVPAYVVVPPGKGPFAAVLYGHWMMPGSPMKNRREFLDEAVALAQSGAMALLIDAPMVRPGYTGDKDPLSSKNAYALVQQVVDFRRGIDILLSRRDVDRRRIAYVGHSFHAKVGAVLAGVDKRISSFVLMAGSYDDKFYVFNAGTPEMLKLRKQYGDAKVREYFEKYPWDEPARYADHATPAAVFLQFGRKDQPISESYARHCYDLFSKPKRIEFYDAGHELNAAARRDRVEWLAGRLKLKAPPRGVLDRIPPLR